MKFSKVYSVANNSSVGGLLDWLNENGAQCQIWARSYERLEIMVEAPREQKFDIDEQIALYE